MRLTKLQFAGVTALAFLLYLIMVPIGTPSFPYDENMPHNPYLAAGLFAFCWVLSFVGWKIPLFSIGTDLENDIERSALESLADNVSEMRQDPDISSMAIARTLLQEAERIILTDAQNVENVEEVDDLVPLADRIRSQLLDRSPT